MTSSHFVVYTNESDRLNFYFVTSELALHGFTVETLKNGIGSRTPDHTVDLVHNDAPIIETIGERWGVPIDGYVFISKTTKSASTLIPHGRHPQSAFYHVEDDGTIDVLTSE